MFLTCNYQLFIFLSEAFFGGCLTFYSKSCLELEPNQSNTEWAEPPGTRQERSWTCSKIIQSLIEYITAGKEDWGKERTGMTGVRKLAGKDMRREGALLKKFDRGNLWGSAEAQLINLKQAVKTVSSFHWVCFMCSSFFFLSMACCTMQRIPSWRCLIFKNTLTKLSHKTVQENRKS